MKSEKTRIEFDYKGEHYRLEYTAASLKKMERAGVKLSKLDEMVFSAQEIIFRGAFYANHPTVSERTIHDIYMALKRTNEDAEAKYDEDGKEIDELSEVLVEMLQEATEEITGRGREGNVTWKVTK